MKIFFRLSASLLFLSLAVGAGADQPPHIQVIDNSLEGDISNYPANVVKLQIINPTYFDIRSKTELLISNTSKSYSGKPIIYQNADRSIVGFCASVARATYKIVLVYNLIGGETVINPNFNLAVADVLKKYFSDAKFNADGLYLDNIERRTLRVGFQSDSGHGSFKFEVQLQPNGHLQMVPHSIVFDN